MSDLMGVLVRFKEELARRGIKARLYLFGSHARGEALDISDVDLAVLSDAFEGLSQDERLRLLYTLWHSLTSRYADIYAATEDELRCSLERGGLAREISRYWIEV
jgi:predicted nucleotidyltransferase